MQRVTFTVDDELLAEIDGFMAANGYQSRSEAFRDLARAGLAELGAGKDEAKICVGALVYVYDREVRDLARRLAEARSHHHDLTVSTTSIDLDHQSCLEVALLRGPTAEVKHHAAHITAERGVRHGRLVAVPVEVSRETHTHGHGKPHVHDHFRVREGG